MTDEEPEYGLVMPFVTVTSKGGPHADEPYAAGYAMGLLAAILSDPCTQGLYEVAVRTDSTEQADLIAMQYGWQSNFEEAEDLPEWTHSRFTKDDDA